MTIKNPHTAFFCDECGRGVILFDGYRESVWDEFDEAEFLEECAAIAVNPEFEFGFCEECHLRVN